MKIDSYNLAEFLAEIQEGFLKGFRLDFKTNENYPFGSGSYYSTTLVPESQPSEQEKTKGTEEAWESRQLGASPEHAKVAVEQALVDLKGALDNPDDTLSVVHKDEAVVPMTRRGRKPGK
jgi:hypothetical protein